MIGVERRHPGGDLFFLAFGHGSAGVAAVQAESMPLLAICQHGRRGDGVALVTRGPAQNTSLMTPKKILLLSVSAGAGQPMRRSRAMRGVGSRGAGMQTRIWMPWTSCHRAFRTLYTEWYLSLVNRQPALWGVLVRRDERRIGLPTSQPLTERMDGARSSGSTRVALVRAIDDSGDRCHRLRTFCQPSCFPH